jgi:uncharacterized protein YhaN
MAMKLLRLTITGFGKLVRREYVLQEGLNVIYGPNESGKSTLQTFIRAMLYGLKLPDAKIRRWRPERALYKPWLDVPYGGALEFMAADGRLYRVERSFDDDRTKIYDLVTGDDLTEQYPLDSRKEYLFAERFTGMNELVFTNTACIGDIPDAGSEKGRRELAARLANLRESGEEATSVRRAVDLLEAARRALVTQVNAAVRNLHEAQAAWDDICEGHEAIRALELDLSELRRQKDVYQQRRDEVALHLLGYRLVALRTKVEQAQQLMGRINALEAKAAPLERLADFPIGLLDEVKTLTTQHAAQEARCKALQEKRLASQERLTKLQAELDTLPGAALISVWAEEPRRLEQAQRVAERFAEMAERTRAHAQRMEAAQAELKAVQEADQRYVALAGLPSNASRLPADLAAINSEAGSTKEHLLGVDQRRRQLLERCDQFRQQAGAVSLVLQRLARFAGLPPEHRQEFEAQMTACLHLAQQLPQLQVDLDALQKDAAAISQAQRVIQATRAMLDHPEQPEAISDIDDVSVREPQLRSVVQVCDRLRRAAAQLRHIEQKLAVLPDLGADERMLMRRIERENPMWQMAEQELADVRQESAALEEQKRALDSQLDALKPVAQAGAMGLAQAEHIHTEELEARRRAEMAAQGVDRVEVPAAGKQVWSGVLVVLGGTVILASLWFSLPLVVACSALLLMLMGGYLFRQAHSARLERQKQREAWYEQKRSALGNAERLSGRLRNMLNQVGQPSVAAWRDAWQHCAQLQDALADVSRRQQLAENQLHQAESQIATARRNALSLMQQTGIELERECTADAVAGALDVLREQLAVHERLKQEREALEVTIASERELLAQEERSLAEQQRNTTDKLAELKDRLTKQLAHLCESVTWMMDRLTPSLEYVPDVDRLKAGILPWDQTAVTRYVNEFQTYLDAQERTKQLEKEQGALQMQFEQWQADLATVLQRGQALQQRWRSCAEAVAKLSDAIPEAAVSKVTLVMNDAEGTIESSEGSELCPSDEDIAVTSPSDEPPGLKTAEQAWNKLRTTDCAPWMRVLDDLATACNAIEQAILQRAQVVDLAAFAALWREWEKHKQLIQERRVACDHMRRAYMEEWRQLQQLLEQQIEPLCSAMAIPMPEAPLTIADDITGLSAFLAEWQPVINTLATRVQAVVAAHVAWQEAVRQEADYAAQSTEQQQQCDETQAQLTAMLHQGGVQTVAEFLAAGAEYTHRQELIHEIQAAQRELRAHLGGKTLDGYLDELAAVQDEWDRLVVAESVAQMPNYADAQAESDWRAQYDQLEEQLMTLRDKQMQLEARLDANKQNSVNAADVAETLQKATEEKKRSERALAAVQLAQQQLSEAVEEVHRQFTPELNAKASALLSQVTEQRYQQVAVSDTLDIRLTDAQYARQVDLNTLSRGAGEQVYLAFRLACVEVIAGARWRVPIILDDAFAHYDDARAQKALEMLIKSADQAGAQILFFTCRSREWYYLKQKAAQLKNPCNIIHLV